MAIKQMTLILAQEYATFEQRVEVMGQFAKAKISIIKDTEWGEYRVRIQGKPAAEYYTDCPGDAWYTALVMLKAELKAELKASGE